MSLSPRELVLVAALGSVGLFWTVAHLRRLPEPLATRRTGERAWLLVVTLRFVSAAEVDKFLTAFGPQADATSRGEPDTLGYEVSRSEQNPLSLMIYERYRTKAAYLDVHKAMKHFSKFRPKLQALQDAKKVEVTGEAYQELGVGFM
jgi:quinol monooxygenase YgiN